MTWIRTREISLLATAHTSPAEWWLAYEPCDRLHWWNRFLEPQFQHVHAMKRDGRVWVVFDPYGEFLDVRLVRTDQQPWEISPRAIFQRIVALRREGTLRSSCFVGPITCTEHVKALLGIRAFWIRTPRQLFNYCRRTFHAQTEGGSTDNRRDGVAAASGRRARAAR